MARKDLEPEELAKILTGLVDKKPVTKSDIEELVKAGAPTSAEGRINVWHLGAWLLRELNGKKR